MILVSKVFADQSAMMEYAMELVTTIVSKSPVAVQGSKINLNYSRDHTVDESLEYMVGIEQGVWFRNTVEPLHDFKCQESRGFYRIN